MISNEKNSAPVGSSVFRPWLWLPAKVSHDLSAYLLDLATLFLDIDIPRYRAFSFRGLHFKNPIGIAGGVDKNGASLEAWWKLGVGFIEVGTVTPEPQLANPGKILARDVAAGALWNRMGFPNLGVDHLLGQLKELPSPRPTPVFVNIGKNRNTPNNIASKDYTKIIQTIGPRADAYVVNLSSPNTVGLRDLLSPEKLEPLLNDILAARDRWALKSTLVLLKISPDLSDDELAACVDLSLKAGIDGFIATNTTTLRTAQTSFPVEGGVSGQPLNELSKRCLKIVVKCCDAFKNTKSTTPSSSSRAREVLIVSTGGIMSANDIAERLAMGAHLVQVYSVLALEGPWFIKNSLRKLLSYDKT
jgi:dihydroorotate dehydrogenase